MSNEWIGQSIGNYQIQSFLGRGGMGVVYLAKHTGLGRRVAIKLLLPEIASKPIEVERFFLEAKAANQIGHRSIVDVSDFGISPDGCPYLIMEYLDGEPLSVLFKQGVPLDLKRVLLFSKQLASALTACHAAGILHRDLKPDNIFLIPPTEKEPELVKILDFGVAKLTESPDGKTIPSSEPNVTIGTPRYMSPEQIMGQDLDGRSDLYAVGLILFEALVGEQPIAGEGIPGLISKRIEAPAPGVRERNPLIPEPIARVIDTLLSRRREDRYESAAALSVALEEAERLCHEQAISPTLSPISMQTSPDTAPYLESKPSKAPKSPAPIADAPGVGVRLVLQGLAVACVVALGSWVALHQLYPRVETNSLQVPRDQLKPMVTLSFVSPLPNTSISLNGERLGELPYELQVEMSNKPIGLLFQKEGYQEQRQQITALKSTTLNITLARSAPESAPVASAPSTQVAAPAKKKKVLRVTEPEPSRETVTPCQFNPNQPHCN